MNLVFMSNLDSYGNVPQGYTFYNNAAANADGYQHMAAFFPVDGRYIIVASRMNTAAVTRTTTT